MSSSPEMQGRVLSLIMGMAAAMTPLGLIIAGPLADTLGVQSWFIIGGAATILMAVSALFIPAIMNLEQGRKQTSFDTQPGLAVISEPLNPGD
ncbi:MAG TPA: hypothetical protein VN363_05585 [Anaerolineales bacterium]|nr:hypothetical protein [Anaerolineales bacterium]